MKAPARTYTMRARAEAVEATRERIARAGTRQPPALAGRGLRGPPAVRSHGAPPHAGRAARRHRRLHLEAAAARPWARPARHPADHDRHGPRDPPHDKDGTMSRRYLFTLWDGSGTVPPELSLARTLIERGHRVTILADPTIEPEATAAGADFRSWRKAPHLRSRRPQDDYLRDFEVDNPPGLIARLCERLICGPASAYAAETTSAIREVRPQVVVSSAFLLGPQIAAEAAGLPLAALFSNIYPLPAPGLPPFGAGLAPARDEHERQMHAAIGQEGRAMWNAHLAPLNAARAQLGLAPLSGVWEQLDHAERVLVLSSPAFDFPARLPD